MRVSLHVVESSKETVQKEARCVGQSQRIHTTQGELPYYVYYDNNKHNLSYIMIILMKAVVIIVAIVGGCRLSWFMTDRSVACCRPD